MDKKQQGNRWDWLPAFMPGVAKIIADKKQEHGAAHVNECWRRAVVGLEPGWFYAAEGPLTVGVPWPDPELDKIVAGLRTKGQAFVRIRLPEGK